MADRHLLELGFARGLAAAAAVLEHLDIPDEVVGQIRGLLARRSELCVLKTDDIFEVLGREAERN